MGERRRETAPAPAPANTEHTVRCAGEEEEEEAAVSPLGAGEPDALLDWPGGTLHISTLGRPRRSNSETV
jgi:hypothetical protein